MSWLFLGVICILFSVTAVVAWQKWVAPWRQIEQLVRQIVGNEHPRTFLVGGGPESKRVGLALENIFARQQELGRQIAGRESGTQTILRAMQDGLLVVDKSLRVTLVNQAFRKLFGLPEISLGAPLLDVVREATVDRLIAETLRTGKAMQSELVRADSKTNSERDVEISAVPVKDDAGLTTGAVVLFHDITQLKQTDKVRRDFVANVSHELRTPLSILRGYIETLLDNPQTSDKELSRILRVMERHSKRLGLLVDDLLTLAHLESRSAGLQFSDVQLAELFQSVIRDWEKKLAEKQLKVVVDLSPDAAVLAATFLFCLLAAVLFSLGPALKATRADLVNDLKQQVGEPARIGRFSRFFAPRHISVMAQIALSLMLLFAAGLFFRGALKAAGLRL